MPKNRAISFLNEIIDMRKKEQKYFILLKLYVSISIEVALLQRSEFLLDLMIFLLVQSVKTLLTKLKINIERRP